MKVDVYRPDVVRISYTQEEGDRGYGSCMYANFDFDQNNYVMTVCSDCGYASYKWRATPDSESFFQLMARIDPEYLIEKLFEANFVDARKTVNYIRTFLDGGYRLTDEMKTALVDLEYELDEYGLTIDEAKERMRNWCMAHFVFCEYVFDYLVPDYSADQKKICEVFKDYIQPKIREILSSADEK